MDITPIDAEVSAKVFYNPNIMDNILNNMEGGLMQNLYLRLVSRIFNAACADIIAKNHVTIKVEYREEKRYESFDDEIEDEQTKQLEDAQTNLYVNYRSVNILKIDGYFKLLKRFSLNLENIIFVNLSKLKISHREILHTSIIFNSPFLKTKALNSFIGACDVCLECEVCELLAMESQEYGPIQLFVSLNSDYPKHFRKLILDDNTLNFRCNEHIFREKSFQERLHANLGHRFISCDTLVFQVSDNLLIEFDENADANQGIFKHNPIPREVLEWLIEQWRVKFLKIDIGYEASIVLIWNITDFFTKLVLNNPPDSEEYKEKLQPALEHVHLDFAEASFLSVSVSEYKPAWKCILGNVQNIFSTNHFKISLSPMSHHTPELIREVLKSVLEMVSKKHEKKFMIDVRYNMKLEEFSVCPDIYSIWQSIKTSSSSYKFTISTLNECMKRNPNALKMNPYNNGEWIGKKLKLEDIRNNWTINFEVWIIN